MAPAAAATIALVVGAHEAIEHLARLVPALFLGEQARVAERHLRPQVGARLVLHRARVALEGARTVADGVTSPREREPRALRARIVRRRRQELLEHRARRVRFSRLHLRLGDRHARGFEERALGIELLHQPVGLDHGGPGRRRARRRRRRARTRHRPPRRTETRRRGRLAVARGTGPILLVHGDGRQHVEQSRRRARLGREPQGRQGRLLELFRVAPLEGDHRAARSRPRPPPLPCRRRAPR